MKKIEKEIAELIPISDSVKLIDEQFPHLIGIRWNSREDEEEGENKK